MTIKIKHLKRPKAIKIKAEHLAIMEKEQTFTLAQCQAARFAVVLSDDEEARAALRMIRGRGHWPPPEWRDMGSFVAINTLNGRFADVAFYRDNGFEIIHFDQLKTA